MLSEHRQNENIETMRACVRGKEQIKLQWN